MAEQELVSAGKANRELGWAVRPLNQTILDTAVSLINHQLVGA